MKQEDKELLLRDLCARLLYGVKIEGYELPCIILNADWYLFIINHPEYEIRKPYLRPMSSMTEEERNEYFDFRSQELQRVAFAEVGREEAISEVMD